MATKNWDEEIKRKALQGIALTNPTKEAQAKYDTFKQQANTSSNGITYKPSGTIASNANYGKTTQGVTGQAQYNPIGTITASPTASNIQLTDDMVKEIANKAANGTPLTNWSRQKQELYNSYTNPAPTYQTYSGSDAPTYNSQYQSQIQNALSELLSKTGNFSYNYEDDPLYQQYKESYRREADRALENTMAQATAQTGGRMNSNAITVGQQAANYHNAQLNDKIPELEQYAYQKYIQDLTDQRNNILSLQNLEAQDYAKYQDQLAQYNTDRAFDYQALMDQNNYNYQNYRDTQNYNRSVLESDSAYDYNLWQAQNALSQDKRNYEYQLSRDAVSDSQWQKQFDQAVSEFAQQLQFNKDRAAASDSQWQQAFDYQKGQDAISNSHWQKQFEADQAQLAIQNLINGYDAKTGTVKSKTTKSSSASSGYNMSDFSNQIEAILGEKNFVGEKVNDKSTALQQVYAWVTSGMLTPEEGEQIANMYDLFGDVIKGNTKG